MIDVVWFNGSRGFWDNTMLMDSFRGELYPIPNQYRFNEIVQRGYEWRKDVSGGVVVVQARCHVTEADMIKAQLDRMKWAVVVCAGDEEASFPWRKMKADKRVVWVQCPMPGVHDDADYYIPTGARPQTRETIQSLGDTKTPPHFQRMFRVGFGGQSQNAIRGQCVDMLRNLPEPKWSHISQGFGAGIAYGEYMAKMMHTQIVLSPTGNYTPDCFRAFEAMECGALPISNNFSPAQMHTFKYWEYLDRFAPRKIALPTVNVWSQFPNMLSHYISNPLELLKDTNRAVAWWLAKKREFTVRLMDDVGRLSGIGCEPSTTLRDRVTVVMPSNAIPDHPSTELIEDSIRRVRSYPELRDCEIIVTLDGLKPDQSHRAADYEEYKRRLLWLCNWHPDFKGVLPVLFDQHCHQAEMTKQILPLIRTPLLFYVEHDTYPMGEIDFRAITNCLMAGDEVRCVRLHNFDRILEEHRYLYPDWKESKVIHGLPVCRTTAWSQRPHLAWVRQYKEWLDRYTRHGENIFIEHALYGPVCNAPQDQFRIAIYTPTGGNILRSGHSNGRKGTTPS